MFEKIQFATLSTVKTFSKSLGIIVYFRCRRFLTCYKLAGAWARVQAILTKLKEITAPPSWTKACKTIVLFSKFFFVPYTQRKLNIWTTPSYST